MAKVTITATPRLTNTNVLADDDVLTRALKTLGKNGALLSETRDLLAGGYTNGFARFSSALDADDDFSCVVRLSKDGDCAVMEVLDKGGKVIGRADFDWDAFYNVED